MTLTIVVDIIVSMIDYSYLDIQNPWWKNPQAINADEKLVEFEKLKFKYTPAEILNLPLQSGDINIITGPRQTGKSTALKLYIRNLLQKKFPPRSILFFNCDAFSSEKDLIDLVMNFIRDLQGEKVCLILDEVTSVNNWPQAIKWLVDTGILKQAAVFLTGSSSISFKKSGEFLPGRRGKGKDIVFLPITFADYLLLHGIKKLDWNYKQSFSANKNSAEINSHFNDFFLSGGLLRNINYGASVNTALYLATLKSELFKNGKKEDFLREVIRKLLNSLSSQTSYTNIAEEAELGSKNTAIDYLSFLSDSFFLKETKFYEINQKRIFLKKNKKYYTVDPYFVWMFWVFVNGEESFRSYPGLYSSFAEKGKLIENFLASELVKTRAEFYFYQNSRELDFILPKQKIAIEVKYKNKIVSEDLRSLKEAPKNFTKILVSKNTLEKREDIQLIPAHLITLSEFWPKRLN